jgi:hypothetical protein
MTNRKKLTIVITIRQLVIASAIAVVVTLGLVGFYLHRTMRAGEEEILALYKESGRDLRRELRRYPAIMENDYRLERYTKADRILTNNYFDPDVMAFSFELLDYNGVGPFARIRYVDELMRVARVNYAPPTNDPCALGELFLAPENMPGPSMRIFGTTDLCIALRVDEILSDGVLPYVELDGERLYLVVARTSFDSILAMEGQFILLGKEGSVLDRFGLKELSGEAGGAPVSDANAILGRRGK